MITSFACMWFLYSTLEIWLYDAKYRHKSLWIENNGFLNVSYMHTKTIAHSENDVLLWERVLAQLCGWKTMTSRIDFSMLQHCRNNLNTTFNNQHSTMNTTLKTTNNNDKKDPTKPYEMAKNEVKNFASPKPPIWRPGDLQIANLAVLSSEYYF